MTARDGTAAEPERIRLAALYRGLQAAGGGCFGDNILVVDVEERDERSIRACLVHSGLGEGGENGVIAAR